MSGEPLSSNTAAHTSEGRKRKCLAPVHRYHVLTPVQKPQRLPSVDAGGGPPRELLHGGTQSARESFTSPVAASGKKNQGEAVRKRVSGGVCMADEE